MNAKQAQDELNRLDADLDKGLIDEKQYQIMLLHFNTRIQIEGYKKLQRLEKKIQEIERS